MEYQLHEGDCLEVLKTLDDNSVDAVVTDPPYGLEFMGKDWDAPWQTSSKSALFGKRDRPTPGWATTRNPNCTVCHGRLRGDKTCSCDVPSWDEAPTATNLRQMRGFQEWCEAWAGECLRVLKPGGHLAAFSGTRTYHRMACAIEDAGFEVRDQLAWVYGQGFPKSLDVSRALDDHFFGEWLDKTGNRAAYNAEIKAHEGDAKQHVERKWRKAAGAEREVVGEREVWGSNAKGGRGGQQANGLSDDADGTRKAIGITAPATDAAREWEGWGTALKPAWEPICLARKPLSEKTVAANVLRWGTGVLNVGACKIEALDAPERALMSENAQSRYVGTFNGGETSAAEPRTTSASQAGRFPANLCHDGSMEVLDLFPETKSGNLSRTSGSGEGYGFAARDNIGHVGDSGSASRFFYCAKASKGDRAGSKHPTVKPVRLMQWLCRLLCPPGGTILDMFAGSGTTGMAAWLEGLNSILIEREAEYIADIRRRMDRVPYLEKLQKIAAEFPDLEMNVTFAGDLFSERIMP